MAQPAQGEVFGGKYRLEELLDPGPPTATCKATRISDGLAVTLKLLNPVLAADQEHRGRFEREARVMARVRHPSVPAVVEFGGERTGMFLAMELSTGETLADRLSRTGGLSAEETIAHVEALLDVLQLLHENKVVVRDLSPRTLVLASGRGKEQLRIVDFRSARVGDEEVKEVALTRYGATLGSPDCQAPEQVSGAGKADGRTDLYALGCIAYAMLTGSPPFQAKLPHEVLIKHLKEEPEPPSRRKPALALPPGLEAWVLKLMRKAPEQRYPGARAALDGLREALRTGSVPQAAPPTLPSPGSTVDKTLPARPGAMASRGGAPTGAGAPPPSELLEEASRAATAVRAARSGVARAAAPPGGVPWGVVVPMLVIGAAVLVYLAIR
jgi:serine/threonine-protein kinase